MKRNAKCLKILANLFQQHIKDSIMWKMGFMLGRQGWFDSTLERQSSVTYYIKGLRRKKHMIILVDAENVFGNIQYPLMIRNSQKTLTTREFI